MIGWRPCHTDCGCLDEDACLLAPKNQTAVRPRPSPRKRPRKRPEKPAGEFCLICGTHIPPRPGEGFCSPTVGDCPVPLKYRPR